MHPSPGCSSWRGKGLYSRQEKAVFRFSQSTDISSLWPSPKRSLQLLNPGACDKPPAAVSKNWGYPQSHPTAVTFWDCTVRQRIAASQIPESTLTITRSCSQKHVLWLLLHCQLQETPPSHWRFPLPQHNVENGENLDLPLLHHTGYMKHTLI